MTIDIEKLRSMPRGQQIVLLHHTFRYTCQPGSPKHYEARQLQDDMEAVWRDETYEKMNEQSAAGGLVYFETPERGVLGTMGYRVGAAHTEKWLRQEILKWVLIRELPFVHSVGYIRQWGAPGSRKRLRKLDNALMGFMENASGRAGHMQALKHWCRDQIFVRENYLSSAAAE